MEDARKAIGEELHKTDENGTTLAQELEKAANEDLNKTLAEGEKELPEVGKKFVEDLTKAFNEGFIASEIDENGKTKFTTTEKLNQASKAGYEAGAEEIKNQLNKAFEALNKLFED